MSTKIEHDPSQGIFFADMDGKKARLSYSREGNVMDMTSVYVPPEFRGKGMGARLTKTAFEYAKEQNCRVIPTCPFIRNDFLESFPQYREMVAG